MKYCVHVIFNYSATMLRFGLIIIFVVYLQMNAEGALYCILIAEIIMLIPSLYLLFRNSKFSIRVDAVFESVMEKAEVMFFYTAGKKEVRSWFAEKNAKNLMFAEDAARRIKNCLIKVESINNFTIKVSHQESLHPHNAEAYVSFP